MNDKEDDAAPYAAAAILGGGDNSRFTTIASTSRLLMGANAVGLALPPSALSSSESANSIVENNPNNQSLLPTKRPRTYNTKGFKRRTRKLTSHGDRRLGGNKKRTHFDHHQYRAAQANQAPAQATTAIIPSCSNRGHSPTKSQVKQMCEQLPSKNRKLKKLNNTAEKCLKRLLTEQKDLHCCLRLESTASNKFIASIFDEANALMNNAKEILSAAKQTKREAIEEQNKMDWQKITIRLRRGGRVYKDKSNFQRRS